MLWDYVILFGLGYYMRVNSLWDSYVAVKYIEQYMRIHLFIHSFFTVQELKGRHDPV
jgi:hypothetical protein